SARAGATAKKQSANAPISWLPVLFILAPRLLLLKPPQLQILLILLHRVQQALYILLIELGALHRTSVGERLFRFPFATVAQRSFTRIPLLGRLRPSVRAVGAGGILRASPSVKVRASTVSGTAILAPISSATVRRALA